VGGETRESGGGDLRLGSMQAGTFEKKGASARVQRKRAWREEKATRCLISRGVDTVI